MKLLDQDYNITFLGFCERAAMVPEGGTGFLKWNIIGLKQIVFSYIYPLPLKGTGYFLFTFRGPGNFSECRFQVVDDAGNEVGWIKIEAKNSEKESPEESPSERSTMRLHLLPNSWVPIAIPLKDFEVVLPRPGMYRINLQLEDQRMGVGQILYALANPLPLTDDRITAIKSDPAAAKAIKLIIGCKHCDSKYNVYAALSRSETLEKEKFIWHQNIQENFICGCKKTNLDLRIVKSNLHGLLGQRKRDADDIQFIPLYEKGSLEHTRGAFWQLLKIATKEEELQRFLAENPILLHQFPAERLFLKPKILTFFSADFAVVAPDKKLILIELEKQTTRLLKKDGGLSAELNHAFDQVRNWLHVVDEHRLAVLDSLGIDRDEVSAIKGVVIAGRDNEYDKEHLRKLKGSDYGRISLFTYDDLVFSLDDLIRKMDTL